jgi:hypothetical protein
MYKLMKEKMYFNKTKLYDYIFFSIINAVLTC